MLFYEMQCNQVLEYYFKFFLAATIGLTKSYAIHEIEVGYQYVVRFVKLIKVHCSMNS